MMLNFKKCIFGISSGKLLSFLISKRGIKENPDKIKAIDEMRSPSSIREVQKLTRCMASLSRFISHLGEKGLPFFELLRKHDVFEWTPRDKAAFQDLKRYLSSSHGRG